MRGERVLIIFYLLIFTSLLVWYVSEYLLVWDPESGIWLDLIIVNWYLPKPVFGALLISITWIVMNYLLFFAYLVDMWKRIKKVRGT